MRGQVTLPPGRARRSRALLLALAALVLIALGAVGFVTARPNPGTTAASSGPTESNSPTESARLAPSNANANAPASNAPASNAPASNAPAATSGATLSPSVEPTSSLSPGPTAGATGTPSAGPPNSSTPPTPPPSIGPANGVAVALNGVLLPPDRAADATRHPYAVMIDDQAGARPQSGLGAADIVYQAPAEGGIPRYMAVFQANDPRAIGPIRSSRLYYVGWAAEWNAMYVHHGGSPNSLSFLKRVGSGQLVYDADGFRYERGYMRRIRTRAAPHNLYTSGTQMRSLQELLGATAPLSRPGWTFTDETPLESRPAGGTLVVPYPANRVTYRYDRATNRYLRGVTGERVQRDAATGSVVAPANVIVQYVVIGRLQDTGTEKNNEKKGRLELGYLGSGKALVVRNGEFIEATWSKRADAAVTQWLYATGPNAGQPIPLVRGQIFVQVVPTTLKVTRTLPSAP